MIIGSSIVEAINWSQDRLRCSRPDAERALFALLEQAVIVEAEDGFGYADEDEAEVKSKHGKYTTKPGHGPMRMALWSKMLTNATVHRALQAERHERRRRQHLSKKLDSSDAAEDMMAADPDALS